MKMNEMPDREKVIKGLENCRELLKCVSGAGSESRKAIYGLCDAVDDALALLKAQEPVEPVLDEVRVFRCAKCNQAVGYKDVNGITFPHCIFCFKCGQAVKWE